MSANGDSRRGVSFVLLNSAVIFDNMNVPCLFEIGRHVDRPIRSSADLILKFLEIAVALLRPRWPSCSRGCATVAQTEDIIFSRVSSTWIDSIRMVETATLRRLALTYNLVQSIPMSVA